MLDLAQAHLKLTTGTCFAAVMHLINENGHPQLLHSPVPTAEPGQKDPKQGGSSDRTLRQGEKKPS